MKLNEIIKFLEKKYRQELAEEWDNSGLLVGHEEKDIEKLGICLDITIDVVEQAVAKGLDLLISHHPLIFSEIKQINDRSIIGRKILKLIENGIAVYSIHTNADSALGGLNDEVMELLGFEGNISILSETAKTTGNDQETGSSIGRIIELNNKKTLKELLELIKSHLGIEYLRAAGNPEKIIKKIGLVTGSGGSFITLLPKDIDLFISGDLKHHETLDALEDGKALIDIGHYESEIYFSNLIKKDLKGFFTGEVINIDEEPVFYII